ncbi:hypothetical protein IW261DRAFT_1570315 [Armillaria novae-zelandiae]|uniref:Uncharacterized protein n=1 Tax=Armillaria novae-zelandiae TaxID=153914 RepID=A0AA39NWN2_9AGAR|nr:hypothetical protein IW261DRAFT_1570315 [Armillaria novae-zelandiae]
MSTLIPLRLKCLPPCLCGEFYNNESAPPGSTHLKRLHCLACHHPWHSHASKDVSDSHPLYRFRRRGLATTKCQGFFPENASTLISTPWSPDTVCVCGGLWWLHASYHNDSDQPPPSENVKMWAFLLLAVGPSFIFLYSPAPAPPGNSNSSGPKSGSLQVSPPPGSATASILHGLPPPITAFSEQEQEGVQSEPQQNWRHEFEHLPLPLGDTQFDVGPMGPQTLSFRADQLSTVYDAVFKRRALTFGLSIPSKSSPLGVLYQVLKEAAATGNYVVPSLKEFDASHPDLAKIQYDGTFPFMIMEHQVRDGRYKFQPDGRLCPNNFSNKALQKLCKNFNPLPEGSSNAFFLVIAPRFGNITASLDDFECQDKPQRCKEVHRCWPYRVLYDAGKAFYRFHSVRGNSVLGAWPNPITCLDGCPADIIDSDDDISNFSSCAGSPMKGVVDLTPKDVIEIPDSPDRDFSPPPVEIACTARVAIPDLSLTLAPSLSLSSDPVLPYSPPRPSIQSLSVRSSPSSSVTSGLFSTMSNFALVSHWRNSIYHEVTSCSWLKEFELEGSSLQVLAHILWKWFLFTVRNPPASFKVDEYPDITVFSLSSQRFEFQHLLARYSYDRQYRMCALQNFTLQVTGIDLNFSCGSAVGPVVEHVVQLASLQEMVSNCDYWRRRADGSFSLYVSASGYVSQRRTDYLEASGRMIAWSLLHLGQGFVISPWVVLAIVAGREAFSALTHEDIAVISTADAAPLRRFLALEPKSTLQYDASQHADNSVYNDVRYIFGLTLGFDMVDLKYTRSEEEHAQLKGRVCCAVLLDHDTYWEHPDFLALRKGFDLQLHYRWENITLLSKTKRYPAMRLIQQLYSPFVDVEDLIAHIEFKVPGEMDLPEDGYQRAVFLLFQHRIKTYLRGRGHPRSTRGGLGDEAQFDKEKDVATIRGALLLSAMQGLPRPPIDPSYSLTFNCSFPSNPHGAMLEIHACLNYADIGLTKDIVQMLAAPGDDEDHPSFAFFHGQCINAMNDFNAV